MNYHTFERISYYNRALVLCVTVVVVGGRRGWVLSIGRERNVWKQETEQFFLHSLG